MSAGIDPIVIDNGAYAIKSGFAGDDSPKSATGPLEYLQSGDLKSGKQPNNPIKNGIITSVENMEKIWHSMFYNDLRVDPELRSVLLTESPDNPEYNREQTIASMFEQFNVPAAFITSTSNLSLLTHGKTSGVAVDLGHDCGFVTPVQNLKIISNGCKRLGMAGSAITTYLQTILNDEKKYDLHNSKEKDIVREMKESLCYVAKDFELEMKEYENDKSIDKEYDIPSGRIFKLGTVHLQFGSRPDFTFLGNERFRAPESLFRPALALGYELKGIHELVYESIMSCDSSLQADLFSNIYLAGGSSLFHGLATRLQKEVQKLAPNHIVIVYSSDSKYSAWIGGSILASTESFDRWITKQEYNECGPKIAHKCLTLISQ